MRPDLPTADPARPATVYTVGHSNHELAKFLELLRLVDVATVADVRTSPFSHFNPHFNRPPLARALKGHGIDYIYMGDELGGRPDGDEFYDADGHVRYDRLARSARFGAGVKRLLDAAEQHRVVMMCSEADPANCHRHLLLGRVLNALGVAVVHIESDGSTSDYLAVAQRTPTQRSLFAGEEDSQWRSPRSTVQSTVLSNADHERRP